MKLFIELGIQIGTLETAFLMFRNNQKVLFFAGLGISSLVFRANGSFVKKRGNCFFVLFKRANHSYCSFWATRVISSRCLHEWWKAKPKSVMYIFKSSFQFSLQKGAKPTLKKSESLLCSIKWKEWITLLKSFFEKSDGSESLSSLCTKRTTRSKEHIPNPGFICGYPEKCGGLVVSVLATRSARPRFDFWNLSTGRSEGRQIATCNTVQIK